MLFVQKIILWERDKLKSKRINSYLARIGAWSFQEDAVWQFNSIHCQRVTVWCAISSVGIIGAYFFKENERAVTLNAARYREMIEKIFLPHLEEMDVGDVWFQQTGATAHTARASMELLRERFPDRLISLRGDLP